jgi:hypothetical protein
MKTVKAFDLDRYAYAHKLRTSGIAHPGRG